MIHGAAYQWVGEERGQSNRWLETVCRSRAARTKVLKRLWVGLVLAHERVEAEIAGIPFHAAQESQG